MQIGSGNKRLVLNTTAAQATGSGLDSPYIGSSVFTLSDGTSRTNDGESDYIAYCFASIEGYSKVGKYTGNGNADGPFIYTGFSPAYVMIKRIDGTSNWAILDNKRPGYNVTNEELNADSSVAESANAPDIDFTSNGFKRRDTEINANSRTYLYLAFASYPFKYSPAR